MKKSAKLKIQLLFVPSLLIICSLAIILLVFNFSVQNYIDTTSFKQLSDEMQYYEEFYKEAGNSNRQTPQKRSRRNQIVEVNHFIMDASAVIVYPATQGNQQGKRAIERDILAQLQISNVDFTIPQTAKIKVDESTYYVRMQNFNGNFEDKAVTRQTPSDTKYIILAYADITLIQSFLDMVNQILMILMFVFSILAIFIIFGMVRNIENSMEKLKNTLRKIGNRERIAPLDRLPYQEFNELAGTMQEMSTMIDKAETSQIQFFQNASHELRTPLMSIQGYAEAMQQRVVEEDRATSIILKESDKMSALVDEILFLSKLDSDSVEQQRQAFDIKELVYECIGQIKAEADKRKIKLNIGFPEQTVLILGMEKQIERALMNVFSNAIRYAQSRIDVVCIKQDKVVSLSIANDGKMIPKEELEHIFERFYKGEGGNFGIGLSIAYEVMRKHQGAINVTSNENETCFIFRFPL